MMTLDRCKCGDPVLGFRCDHCDTPCKNKPDECPRCVALNQWEPWEGYKEGRKSV